MKKVIFTITLILAVAIVSGYKISRKNDNTAATEVVTSVKNPMKTGIGTSDTKPESTAAKNYADSKPKVLFLLKNETGIQKWSPSLWWNYKYSKTGQPGC
jgi:uncharacterized protein YxeA